MPRVLALPVAAALSLLLLAVGPVRAAAPRRLVLIVLDQCRADLPDRFPMPRVEALRREGTSFTEAIVGHLASETVVSHPVMSTGLEPRHMPWGDEVFADPEGRLGKAGEIWLTTGLTLEQMSRLMAAVRRPPSLPELLHARGHVYAVGSKSYAAYGLGAPGADSVIILESAGKTGPWADWKKPDGRAVPPWIASPPGNRYYVNGTRTYGTERLEYPIKGDQYVAGPDPAHEGGDLWVANVATEVMSRDPRWSALLLTMAGIDKVGHLLGDHEHPVNLGQAPELSMATAAATADRAVGRVLDALEAHGLAGETLVVLTSDHGGYSGRLVGATGPGRASPNWYYGVTANQRVTDPSTAVAPLAAHPGVRFIMADTAVRAWLASSDAAAVLGAARVASRLPGVRQVFGLMGGKYVPLFRASEPAAPREAAWNEAHVAPLLATLAAPHAPQVVALLAPDVTYGARGDHGGHQELAQRIPLVFRGPGVARGVRSKASARLADIVPSVSRALGFGVAAGYDGRPLELASPAPAPAAPGPAAPATAR